MVKCRLCGQEFKKITHTHLEEKHNMKLSEYKGIYPDAKLVNKDLIESYQEHKRGKTYEEIYGKKRARQIKERTSKSIKKSWESEERMRKQKEGKYISNPKPKETRERMSKSHIKTGINVSRKIAYKNYPKECMHCGITAEEHKEKYGKRIPIHHKDGNPYNNDPENLAILCLRCHAELENKKRLKDDLYTGDYGIKRGTIEILKSLGVDFNNENFKNTPNRVARTIIELCSSCFIDVDEEIEKVLSAVFPADYDEIITGTFKSHSLCPHHLLPVFYKIKIAYLPDGYILGSSKLGRLSNLVFSQPILQEEGTQKIADCLYNSDFLHPKGCMVVVEGKHTCMTIRGIEDESSKFVTSAVYGDFREDRDLKREALELIYGGR